MLMMTWTLIVDEGSGYAEVSLKSLFNSLAFHEISISHSDFWVVNCLTDHFVPSLRLDMFHPIAGMVSGLWHQLGKIHEWLLGESKGQWRPMIEIARH